MNAPADFSRRRSLALRILTSDERLTRKAGSFLGQLCVDPSPLTAKQIEWLETLGERAGLAMEV